MSKINELEALACDRKPDLILLTETWLNNEINTSEITINGYQVEPDLRIDRSDTAAGIGGGLLVYSRQGTKIIPVKTNSTFNQHCNFKLMTKSGQLNVFLIYRPPSTDANNTAELCRLVENVEARTIIIGDFNLPGINWDQERADSKGRPLLEAATRAGLVQLVEGATHIKGNTLDLVLCNLDEINGTVTNIGRLGNSDHVMLWVELGVGEALRGGETTRPRNWKGADYQRMREELAKCNWMPQLEGESVDKAWTFFKSKVHELTEQFVPVLRQREPGRPRWMNGEISKLLRAKRTAWRKYSRDGGAGSRQEYDNLSTLVKKTIRKAKARMEREIADRKEDNGKLFRNYVKSKTKLRQPVGPLKDNQGKTISEPLEMAHELNAFFSSVFSKEDRANIPEKESETASRLDRVVVTEQAIRDKILKLKPDSAAGPDCIHPRFLRETVNEICKPLKIIFEKSLRERKCPQDWKSAVVTPIYKKGPKSQPNNYRPVSLTSVPCKLLESIIKDHIMQHLDNNGLIRDTQHGFMKGRSCTTNLVTFFDKVSAAVDRGDPVDIFYLDFAKAFDKVPRERLLVKIAAKGVAGEVLGWLRDWLTGRTQVVSVMGEKSQQSDVESGVPQGTVLGPPLFNIFIDDLDEAAELIEFLSKFADDTKGMKIVRTDQDREVLQQTLDRLYAWAEQWGMVFNLEKCKIMHVGRNNPKFKYSMGGVELAETEEEKDVGVVIHSSLKPAQQCARAAATAVLKQISRHFHFRDRHIFLRLYKQYVRPHIEFATPAWSPWLRGDVDCLEKVQQKAVKMVAGLSERTYEGRCAELGLDTLEERRRKQDLTQAFKIIRGMDKTDASSLFKFRESTARTRQADDALHLEKREG